MAGSSTPESFTGLPASEKRPASGSSAVTTMLRARTCGSARTWATSFSGPQGMPQASSAASHSAVARAAKAGSSSLASSSTLRVRSSLLRKRGSRASSGRSNADASFAKSASLPAATITYPSRVAKAWKGAIEGWREPSGPGTEPVAT